MASLLNSLICAAAALLVYAGLGLPLALRVAPRPLALMLAPALGWAVHSALALPLLFLIGLSWRWQKAASGKASRCSAA